MYVSIDIGGTKTTVAAFEKIDPASQLNSVTYPTPAIYTDALKELKLQISAVTKNKPVRHLAISFASHLDASGTIKQKSNLPDYFGHNLLIDLKPTLHVPMSIRNDAVCAARAEIFFGHGQDHQSILHLIMGTGFGGAFIKKFASVILDLPLEPEFTFIQSGGMPHSHYQIKGLLGAYIAGNQLEAQLGQSLINISNEHRIWSQVSQHLTLALINFTLLFEPDIITFSGGLIQHRPFILDQVKIHSLIYQDLRPLPPLKLSAIKDNASLIGALTLCKE